MSLSGQPGIPPGTSITSARAAPRPLRGPSRPAGAGAQPGWSDHVAGPGHPLRSRERRASALSKNGGAGARKRGERLLWHVAPHSVVLRGHVTLSTARRGTRPGSSAGRGRPAGDLPPSPRAGRTGAARAIQGLFSRGNGAALTPRSRASPPCSVPGGERGAPRRGPDTAPRADGGLSPVFLRLGPQV